MRANRQADREKTKRQGEYTDGLRQKRGLGGQQMCAMPRPSRFQFPPVVRPRFRGLRLPAADDCSALACVGDDVSPPPFRFSVAFAVEGVDDPAEAGAVGLGAFACCGVFFALSGDDPGEDVDGVVCGIVAGGICAEDGAVDDMDGVNNECVDGPAFIVSGRNGP